MIRTNERRKLIMLHESEIRFEDPVGEDIYEAIITYCNEHDIDLDDFCRLALKALQNAPEAS